MSSKKKKALTVWKKLHGTNKFAKDFHGRLMALEGYGNPNYFTFINSEKIYCGWNIHHIRPRSKGGSNEIENLTCTNIATNQQASDKITYWIDGCKYQVRKCDKFYKIDRLV